MLLPQRPGEAHFFHIPARTQKSASDKHTGLNSVNSLLLSTLIPLSFPSHLVFFLLAAFLSLTFERQKHSLQPCNRKTFHRLNHARQACHALKSHGDGPRDVQSVLQNNVNAS